VGTSFQQESAEHGEKWTPRKASKMEPAVQLTKVDFPPYESNASDNEWQEASQSPQAFEAEETEGELAEAEAGEETCERCR